MPIAGYPKWNAFAAEKTQTASGLFADHQPEDRGASAGMRPYRSERKEGHVSECRIEFAVASMGRDNTMFTRAPRRNKTENTLTPVAKSRAPKLACTRGDRCPCRCTRATVTPLARESKPFQWLETVVLLDDTTDALTSNLNSLWLLVLLHSS